MKLNKYEKIALIITILITICGGLIAFKRYNNIIKFKKSIFEMNNTIEYKLPDNFTSFSKQYNAYESIYTSDKPIFIYGYDSHTLDKKNGLIFHEELNKKLADTKINYKVIAFKNWENINDDLREKYDPNSESCTMISEDQEELNTFLKITSECLMNSCIIDAKAKKYYQITRDINYITSVLKESYPPEADINEDYND